MIRAVMWSPRSSALERIAIVGPLALAACGHTTAEAPIANHGRPAESGVRAIDWQNRTYALEELGPVAVTNGHADFAIDDDGKLVASGDTPASFRVDPALFGDVDGDGVEDAIIASVLGTGGTGQFSQITVHTLRAEDVIELGEIPGGDRGDGGIRRVALGGNAIIVERNVLAEGDGVCCASSSRRERWVWRGGALVEDVAARGALQTVPWPSGPGSARSSW